VGTIPLTAINIDKIWEESSDYVIAEFEGHLPETVEPGESVDLNMVVKAGEEAVTGIYTLKLVVGCNEDIHILPALRYGLLKQNRSII